MGRELRRKQAKKSGQSLERVETKKDNQIKKYIINIISLLGVFVIIYLLSALFVTKELDWFSKKEKETNVNVVANTILASEAFKQKESSYYVYFYDYDEDEKDGDINHTLIKVTDGIITEYYEGEEITNKLS